VSQHELQTFPYVKLGGSRGGICPTYIVNHTGKDSLLGRHGEKRKGWLVSHHELGIVGPCVVRWIQGTRERNRFSNGGTGAINQGRKLIMGNGEKNGGGTKDPSIAWDQRQTYWD